MTQWTLKEDHQHQDRKQQLEDKVCCRELQNNTNFD